MRVFVKWRDTDGSIREEVELINQKEVYIQGTNISFPIENLGKDMVVFEDEQGLWGARKEDIIEIRQVDIEPSEN